MEQIISNVGETGVSDVEATITWQTNEDATSEVRWGSFHRTRPRSRTVGRGASTTPGSRDGASVRGGRLRRAGGSGAGWRRGCRVLLTG